MAKVYLVYFDNKLHKLSDSIAGNMVLFLSGK
jgi:hypothetical protein